tara:strand:+ start:2519 stop:2731 length:213 start_codon:yes stop_codon:yes gene_type:complete
MTKKQQIEAAQRYWESVLARQKENLSELVEDQVEALESDEPRIDQSGNIIKLTSEMNDTRTVLNNLNTIK